MQIPRAAVLAVVALVLPLLPAPAATANDGFTPQQGITFNNANGTRAEQNAILSQIFRSIRPTPAGEEIDIMSWNFSSGAAVKALVKAQERGVRVRLLQAKGNEGELGRDSFGRLRARLAENNVAEGLTGRDRSWARSCRQSCRGRGGAAHAKFFLFSRSGRATDVVIQASANLTDASSSNQWNDAQTYTNRPGPYDFVHRIFEEMKRDEPIAAPYRVGGDARDRIAFFPGGTKVANDPVLQMLNQVRCRGALNTASGRTKIRIAPDVVRESRGMRLARKVRALWLDGCDVRIGYTVMGLDVGRMLRQPSRRGPVPLAHLVRDTDRDGQFDEYFHMKAMSVIGHVRGNRRGYALLNGSQNWSDASARSDENVGITYRPGYTRQYSAHIDRWYGRFGRTSSRTFSARQLQTSADLDDRMVDGFLFGTGPVDGVDPYALVEMD